MEHDDFYSPENAPAGFAMEDDPIPFEAQASSPQHTITAAQTATVKDAPEAASDTASAPSDVSGDTSAKAKLGGKAEVAEDEKAKRKAHEEAEAKRKAEFDAKQAAKKAAEQEQLDKVAAMSDEEVLAASMQRVSTDTEKLTRRNMKECVAEYIQTKCLEDPAFARKTMHPRKNMIRCFQYISRKAWDYVQDELKANGIQPGPGRQGYGSDVPDDLCYQWAMDYFNDPDAKEDREDEEKFVPKPYNGRITTGKTTSKAKDKGKIQKDKVQKTTEQPKAAPKSKENEGQMSLLGVA